MRDTDGFKSCLELFCSGIRISVPHTAEKIFKAVLGNTACEEEGLIIQYIFSHVDNGCSGYQDASLNWLPLAAVTDGQIGYDIHEGSKKVDGIIVCIFLPSGKDHHRMPRCHQIIPMIVGTYKPCSGLVTHRPLFSLYKESESSADRATEQVHGQTDIHLLEVRWLQHRGGELWSKLQLLSCWKVSTSMTCLIYPST